jgi:UDP-MurNAc hydroxylase
LRFTIVSHAGLLVEEAGKSVLFDPWLVGSCYWRSWWNLPAPEPALVASLRPDYIYISHLHWDHFHGPSLRLFDRATRVIVPRINHRRMVEDLAWLGFRNVIEVDHGGVIKLAPHFELHSFQFGPSNDSAAALTDGRTVLLNANDAKLYGLSLRQVARRFGRIHFLLRSHSSASAIPYCVEQYENHYDEPRSAHHLIPFASNHCFVHPETMRFNRLAALPTLVVEACKSRVANGKLRGTCRIMPPGSTWNDADGFSERHFDYSDVEGYVAHVRQANHAAFARTEALETASTADIAAFEEYFRAFVAAVPRPLAAGRVGFAIENGDGTVTRRSVDLVRRRVGAYRDAQEVDCEISCHARIINDCALHRMFSTWGASKRLRIRIASDAGTSVLGRFLMLLDLHEHALIPLARNLSRRSILTRTLRWREAVQAAALVWSRVRTGRAPTPMELYSRL